VGYSFDGQNRRVTLTTGTTGLDVRDCYSRWKDWVATDDNSKYLPAFSSVGGDPLGGGVYVTTYLFLLNGWKVKPQEADHKLVVSGGVLGTVDASDPFVSTDGDYNVLVQYSQPVRTETVSSGSGLSPEQATMLSELAKIHGLISGTPLVVTQTTRAAGSVQQTVEVAGEQVTVTRVP